MLTAHYPLICRAESLCLPNNLFRLLPEFVQEGVKCEQQEGIRYELVHTIGLGWSRCTLTRSCKD